MRAARVECVGACFRVKQYCLFVACHLAQQVVLHVKVKRRNRRRATEPDVHVRRCARQQGGEHAGGPAPTRRWCQSTVAAAQGPGRESSLPPVVSRAWPSERGGVGRARGGHGSRGHSSCARWLGDAATQRGAERVDRRLRGIQRGVSATQRCHELAEGQRNLHHVATTASARGFSAADAAAARHRLRPRPRALNSQGRGPCPRLTEASREPYEKSPAPCLCTPFGVEIVGWGGGLPASSPVPRCRPRAGWTTHPSLAPAAYSPS